ncbi:ribosome silencing factor [Ligilactobacillus sp. WILCCON 0076]|uniref:Ribosomal silencing factor RsfS n=1 Tax=Ligilactobacillus ubinensis TaxID=2876789 RepID=A0A9X2JLB0_9LACO|nr:ribosome silencing factor [Ligilactobacillus ubinensis]MCP0886724.1 ribosome silencing factor [Ligilactobacillus ubinensis]
MNSKDLLQVVVNAADSKRAEEIVALDMQKISLLADYFVIMQADSSRQVKAIADEIDAEMNKEGVTAKNIEGKHNSDWILLDFGDVVVHVFKTETRQFYNLEKLWANAPMVDVSAWVK